MKNNEKGSISLLFLISSASLTMYYLLFGRNKLEGLLPQNIEFVILALLIVITIFSLFYNLMNIFSSSQSSNDIKKEMTNRLIELSEFVDFANERISHYDEVSKFYVHEIRPIGLDSLSLAKRIVQSLVLRINQTNGLVRSPNKFDLFEAEELIQADLELTDNCLDNLIGAAPCEPIPIDICLEKVSSLLDRVDIELESVKQAA